MPVADAQQVRHDAVASTAVGGVGVRAERHRRARGAWEPPEAAKSIQPAKKSVEYVGVDAAGMEGRRGASGKKNSNVIVVISKDFGQGQRWHKFNKTTLR